MTAYCPSKLVEIEVEQAIEAEQAYRRRKVVETGAPASQEKGGGFVMGKRYSKEDNSTRIEEEQWEGEAPASSFDLVDSGPVTATA
jgi:hypothetical protein